MSFRAKMRHAAMALLLMISLVRGSAVRAASSPDDVAHLIQQLHDPDLQHRRDAARELSTAKSLPPEALEAMAALLERQDQDVTVSRYAWAAVCNAGKPAIPIAMRFAQIKDKSTSDKGIGILGCLAESDKDIWPLLIGIYKRNPASNAIDLLAVVGPPALPILFDALKGDDPTMRAGSLMTIEAMINNARTFSAESAARNHVKLIGPKDLAPIESQLGAALGDTDPIFRSRAAIALNFANPNDERPLPILISLVKERNVGFIGSAITSLQAMGSLAKPAVPALEHVLATDTNVVLRNYAGAALVDIEGAGACSALEQAIARDREWRDSTIRSAAQIKPPCPNLVPVLIGTFHEEYSPSSQANVTLASMGTAAVPALAAALKSNNLYVRQNAADALAAMKPLPPEAVKALTAALKDKNSDVRSIAIYALRDAGGKAQNAAEAADRQREVQAAQASAPDTRLHTMKQIVAPIPPDDEYMYPLETVYIEPLTKSGTADAKFIAVVQAGQDRSDRLVFWKKVSDDKYQQGNVMYSEEEYLGMGNHFDKPFTFEFLYEAHRKGAVTTKTGFFVDAPIRGWRMYTDNIFALDDDQLVPVEFKGEGIDFENGKLTFASPIYKEHDPTCCPTGGIESGTYEIIEDAGQTPPSWKIVVATKQRILPTPKP